MENIEVSEIMYDAIVLACIFISEKLNISEEDATEIFLNFAPSAIKLLKKELK